MSGSSEEKNLPASDKKLDDAREKGQVAKSTEMVTATVTLTCFAYLVAMFPTIAGKFTAVITRMGEVVNQPYQTALRPVASRLGVISAEILLPLLLMVIVAVIAGSVISTGGPVLSFHPLIPKPEVLNPVQGFAKMFSLRKLFDLLKNLLKVSVIGTICIILIANALQPLAEQPSCGLSCAPAVLAGTLRPLLILGSLLFVIVGLFDIVLQKWLFARDQRMTKTEMKQETKNTEGDPTTKQAQRRARQEGAQSRIGLKQATFALSGSGMFVALRYSSVDTRVPTVVARGEGEKAGELMQDARRLKKPIQFDADLTRLVFEQVRLGQPIPKELFQPVIVTMKALELF